MLLSESFGFVETPYPHPKPGTRSREGRPDKFKVKKRPKKTLWFNDDKLWLHDVQTGYGGEYTLVTSEDEEQVVACDRNKSQAYGIWHAKKGKGVTYRKPLPFGAATNPKIRFKDYVQK